MTAISSPSATRVRKGSREKAKALGRRSVMTPGLAQTAMETALEIHAQHQA